MSDTQTHSFNLTQRPYKDNQIDYLHAGKQKQKVTEIMHLGKQGMLMKFADKRQATQVRTIVEVLDCMRAFVYSNECSRTA